MIILSRVFIHFVLLLIGIASASAALAGADVTVVPTGERAGQTAFGLFDSAGQPVAPDPGNPSRFTNLPPGTYFAEVSVGGEAVGGRTAVRLDDGSNQLRVSSATGAAEVPRQIVFQQQLQSAWGFGLYGGWKRTPYNGELSFDDNRAVTMSGRTDLEEDGTSLAIEARYYMRRQQQTLGAQLFLYGTYAEYFGTESQRRFLDLHPPLGSNDSGLSVDEKRSFMFGLGGRWNLAQQLGFELMLGAHATRVRASMLFDESGGGGLNERISRNKTLWGPMLALGLTYPLWKLASGHPVLGVVRYTALRMRDINFAAMSSTFPNFDYRAHFDGGWNQSFQLGLQY